MASSLLLLLDDIAAALDDIAVMSKMAAKKTAGVLGDDLALNAQQVTGVRAERELPIVWGVAKGSFINKLILVPLALLISVIAPWLINPLLMLGGLFLCYEGVEKVIHSLHQSSIQIDESDHANMPKTEDDLRQFEKNKVKGAIRTDFILSAEIIVITLGTVASATLFTKVTVLSLIAIVMTIGVYGLVAIIVKIDDLGLYLSQRKVKLQQWVGRSLLAFAPKLMKALSIVGTLAMFLVGGGIISHVIPLIHHWTENTVDYIEHIPSMGNIFGALVPMLVNLGIGLISGAIVLLLVFVLKKIRSTTQSS